MPKQRELFKAPARISAKPLRSAGIAPRLQIRICNRKRRCRFLGKSSDVPRVSRQILQHNFHLKAKNAKVNRSSKNLQKGKGNTACRYF
jgi:hypothetical protein